MLGFLVTLKGRYGVWRAQGKLIAGFVAVFLGIGAGFTAGAEPIRLVALGDSLTQGYGLAPDQGLVPQLQGWLTERGHDVIVINAGVSGDTTAGGLARLDWTLADGADAMIVTLGGNDLLRGIDPAVSRANLDAILSRLAADGIPALLVGMPAPANYGSDWQQAFAAMYPELAARHGVALYPNFLAPLEGAMASGALDSVFQPDRIHPNPEGVRLVVEALGPSVAALIGP